MKTSFLKQKSMKSFLAVSVYFSLIFTSALGRCAYATEVSDGVLAQSLLISEDGYSNTLKNVVEPYLAAFEQEGYFTGQNSAQIYYQKFLVNNSKGTIVISHGFTENLEKYKELIYYFTKMGYSVYALEHRGHGRSTHLGIDNSQVNVENFRYYITDLKTLVDMAIAESGHNNLFLFAHSMGGLIGARYLEIYPHDFKAAILSAPMLGINSGKYPDFFAKLLATGATAAGFGDDYILGQGPYTGVYDFTNAATSSVARYEYDYNIRLNNTAFQMGGGSYRWLFNSYVAICAATSYLETFQVRVPVLLFQAGNDAFVDNSGENIFDQRVSNCTIKRYDSAKHEIYFETNTILSDYLLNVFDFYQNNLNQKPCNKIFGISLF